MAILGYLATRALRQVPHSSNAITGLLDTRLGYNMKTDKYQPPVPTDANETPEGSIQVWPVMDVGVTSPLYHPHFPFILAFIDSTPLYVKFHHTSVYTL